MDVAGAMHPLDKLAIRRFRGLQDVTLDGLGRINLLVGPNNSGKTSALEAISVFCQPLDLRAWLDAVWQRDRTALSLWPLEWMFPHNPAVDGPFVEGKVAIEGSGHFPIRYLDAFYTPLSRIATKTAAPEGVSNGSGKNGYEQAGARVELHAGFERDPNDTLSRRFDLWEGEPLEVSYSSFSCPVRTVTPVSQRVDPIHRELSDATLGGQKAQIVSLLKELDSQIADVAILTPKGGNPTVFIDYASRGLLPLSAFGDGIRRAFLIALFMGSIPGGALLIDEIESSLHVTVLASLFSWLVKACERTDVQLFATTHSLEALDAMMEAESANLDRIVGYHLNASDGFVRAQRLDGDMLHRLRYERGLDVRL